jgi:hypothetical protein
MVSIAAFQAVDPGSIPGQRNNFFTKSVIVFYRKLEHTNRLATIKPRGQK